MNSKSFRRFSVLLLFLAGACGILPPAQAAINVRLGLINAPFAFDYVAGTVVLQEADSGAPIAGKPVYAKLTVPNRDATQWQPFITGSNGIARILIPRLRRSNGELYDTCYLIAEFNIIRTGGAEHPMLRCSVVLELGHKRLLSGRISLDADDEPVGAAGHFRGRHRHDQLPDRPCNRSTPTLLPRPHVAVKDASANAQEAGVKALASCFREVAARLWRLH